MHLASGDINVQRSRLPEGNAGVDYTVETMAKMAKGEFGARSAKIRALAINLVNQAQVADKNYYGMAEAIHNWVRDHIRYVKDPIGDGENGRTLNQETLSYPEETAFNSQAGDCDDKTILEIALLGSLGIQSYPVVIGTTPGRYSHVYLHIVLPPGKYPHAGEVVPADPIMREWSLGKEAPAYKVKLKKLYTELSGLGTMDLGAYASAPSYLDVKNLSSVRPALASRMVDTGSRGRIMNVAEVTRPSEDLDVMFNRDARIQLATQPADRNSLRPYGPLTARAEKVMTSYLQRVPVTNLRASGPHIRVISTRKNRNSVAPHPKDSGPTVGELCGLNDFLSLLENDINACAGMQGVAGPSDPVHRAGAALIHANSRTRKATRRVHKLHKSIGIFGLGAEIAEEVSAAQAVEKLAMAITMKAKALAQKATNGSPQRLAALHRTLQRLKLLDVAFALPDQNAKIPTGLDAVRHAAAKIDVLASTAHDVSAVRMAQKALFDQGAKAIPRSPLKNPLPSGGVVRDQMGRVMYSEEMAGLGWGGSIGRAVSHATQVIAPAVQHIIGTPTLKNIANQAFNPIAQMRTPVKIAEALVAKNKLAARSLQLAKMAANPLPFQLAKFIKDEPFKRVMAGITPKSTSQPTPTAIAPPLPPYQDPVYDPTIPPDSSYPTDPSNTDPTYDPSQDSPTPDTTYDGASNPYETPVDASSEDYPMPEGAPADTSMYQGDTSSTMPVDTFGPGDMSPASDGSDGGGFDPSGGADSGYDDGSASSDDDATFDDSTGAGVPTGQPAAAPADAQPQVVYVQQPSGGFMAWIGSLFVSPTAALDAVGGPATVAAPVAVAAAPVAAPAKGKRRKGRRKQSGGSDAVDSSAGPDDDAMESVLYQNQAPVDGLGALPKGFFTSPVVVGAAGLAAVVGASTLLQRKKSKMANPVLVGGLMALGLYGYSVTRLRPLIETNP